MNDKKLLASLVVSAVGIAALIATLTIANAKESKTASQPEMKLPPGWTVDDMKACMLASTPGKMHELLTKDAGEWQGKSTMWMGADTEPMMSERTSTVT